MTLSATASPSDKISPVLAILAYYKDIIRLVSYQNVEEKKNLWRTYLDLFPLTPQYSKSHQFCLWKWSDSQQRFVFPCMLDCFTPNKKSMVYITRTLTWSKSQLFSIDFASVSIWTLHRPKSILCSGSHNLFTYFSHQLIVVSCLLSSKSWCRM
jgi:hypothetical protein